jgi:hypothetical protein
MKTHQYRTGMPLASSVKQPEIPVDTYKDVKEGFKRFLAKPRSTEAPSPFRRRAK